MKKLVLSFSVLVIAFTITAQNVSQQQAETIAKNYLNSRYQTYSYNEISEVISHTNSQNEVVYYVFNLYTLFGSINCL